MAIVELECTASAHGSMPNSKEVAEAQLKERVELLKKKLEQLKEQEK